MFQGSDVVTAAASSTSTPFLVPLIKAYMRANGSTEAAMPSSALRKLKSPPALDLCSTVASSTRPIAGFSAVGALCTAWTDFSTCPSRAEVSDFSCSISTSFPEVADFSFSSCSMRESALFNCFCTSSSEFLRNCIASSWASATFGIKPRPSHTARAESIRRDGKPSIIHLLKARVSPSLKIGREKT